MLRDEIQSWIGYFAAEMFLLNSIENILGSRSTWLLSSSYSYLSPSPLCLIILTSSNLFHKCTQHVSAASSNAIKICFFVDFQFPFLGCTMKVYFVCLSMAQFSFLVTRDGSCSRNKDYLAKKKRSRNRKCWWSRVRLQQKIIYQLAEVNRNRLKVIKCI